MHESNKNDEASAEQVTPVKKPKKTKTCRIYIPNGQEYLCEIPRNALGKVLLKQFFDLLNIIETDYFGLYFHDFASFNWWLEPNKSVKKQIKTDLWEFYFGVKFYPPHPNQLHEDCTRYYMVLQLRNDIFAGRLPCTFANHALLGSFVVQSELGDFDHSMVESKHYGEFSFAPNQSEELEGRVRELHKMHKGLTPEQAELSYLQNVCKLPMYGIDLHYSKGSDGVDFNIGIGSSGIHIFRDGSLHQRFPWSRVVKLSYMVNKFIITHRPKGASEMAKAVYKLSNHRSAKKLWKSGVEHHSFFRLARNDPNGGGKSRRRRSVMRIGSSFRFTGRTQDEARDHVSLLGNKRQQPTIMRTQSRRLRSDGGSTISPKSQQRANNDDDDDNDVTNHDVADRYRVEEDDSEQQRPPPLPAKRLKQQQRQSESEAQQQQLETREETTTTETKTIVVVRKETASLTDDDAQKDGDEDSTSPCQQEDRNDDDEDGYDVTTRHLIIRQSRSSPNHQHRYAAKRDESITWLSDLDQSHLSLHQRQIQKMKIEFLAALPPASASSTCSLEALDARLPLRLLPTTNSTSSSTPRKTFLSSSPHHDVITVSPIHSDDDDDDDDDDVIVVVKEETEKEETSPPPRQLDDVSDDVQQQQEDAVACVVTSSQPTTAGMVVTSSSSSVSVANSSERDELEEERVVTRDDVTMDDEVMTSKVEVPCVVTRSVHVHQVVIPSGDNEVRRVSVRSLNDGTDSYVISDMMTSSSSNNSSTCDVTNNKEGSSAASCEGVLGCQQQQQFATPPTVDTNQVIISNNNNKKQEEQQTTQSYSPPVVATETTTITYEYQQRDDDDDDDVERNNTTIKTTTSSEHIDKMMATSRNSLMDCDQLVGSQVISSETDHTVTTTEITKFVHEGVSQVVFDRQIVTTAQQNNNNNNAATSAIDHHQALAEVVEDLALNSTHNGQVNITKVVVEETTYN